MNKVQRKIEEIFNLSRNLYYIVSKTIGAFKAGFVLTK